MIYLASSSPRRAELLTQIGVKFDIIRVNIDESPLARESVEELVKRLSRAKGIKGRELLSAMKQDDLVLAADTLINLNGQVLGKPSSIDHCCTMLRQLSGRQHEVLTAVALISQQGQISQKCSINELTFKDLTDTEIEQYCNSEEPRDKAGAYAIQGKAAIFIKHLVGSYSAVMGLPLFETAQLLQQAGHGIQDSTYKINNDDE